MVTCPAADLHRFCLLLNDIAWYWRYVCEQLAQSHELYVIVKQL